MATVPVTEEIKLRRVALTSLMGTAMEWYDYFIYGLFAALIFDRLFFPNFDPAVGVALSLLSFGIGFLARPVGAVIFGHLGDRIGRRKTLIVTLLVIGISTGLIGLMPTYATIGAAAPLILTSLRFIQGLSLGGEWGGAVLLAVEHAPRKKRVFYGAMPQYGSPIGTILSSGIVALVTLLPDNHLMTWGWRVPFLLSFVFLFIALYIRLKVEESPVWTNTVETVTTEEKSAKKIPLIQLFATAWGRVLIVIVAALFASGGFFLMTTYAVNYGTSILGIASWKLLIGTMLGAALEAITIYIGALLGDRWKAWQVVLIGGIVSLVLLAPILLMISSGVEILVILGIAIGIGMLGLPYGPLGTMIAELFDPRIRYSGIAVSYNIAGLIGGFVPSIAAWLAIVLNGSVATIGLLLGIIVAFTAIGGYLAGIVLTKKPVSFEG
ncbi:MAG: MFS transporter [Canibacter sp.]